MNPSKVTATRIASKAIGLSESERAAFLRQRCGDDTALLEQVMKFISELAASDAACAEMLQTTEPLATIDSFSKLSSSSCGTDTNRAAATVDRHTNDR
jgi:hypothetical protein